MQVFLQRGLCGLFLKESSQEVESNCPKALLLESEREQELERIKLEGGRGPTSIEVSGLTRVISLPVPKWEIQDLHSYLCSGMPATIFFHSLQCCVHCVCRFLFFFSVLTFLLSWQWILKDPTSLMEPQRVHVMPSSLNYTWSCVQDLLKWYSS